MNLQQLFEANILNLDAVTAAIELPLEFKQELAKVVNRVYKVDKKKSFKANDNSWKTKQEKWRLYNEYGTATSSDRFSSRNGMGIKIYLHSKHNEENKWQDYISFYPDTMGNVKIDVSNGLNNSDEIVQIQGKTVQQFLNAVQAVLPRLYVDRDKQETSGGNELNNIYDRIFAEVDGVFDYVTEVEIEKPEIGRYGEKYYNLRVTINKNVLEDIIPKIDDKSDFFFDIGRLINDTAYLKTVYKKKTGKDPGKKDGDSTLASKIRGYGRDLHQRGKKIYLYSKIKEIVLHAKKIIKKHGLFIGDIDTIDRYRGYDIKFSLRYGTETYKSRRDERPVKAETSFNVFKWLKDKKDYNFNDLVEIYNKKLDEELLPIAQQLVKQLFKDK